MNPEPSSEQREHELTMHVFSVSAAMVGVCLTAIGILRLVAAQTWAQTLGDDLLAMDAIVFFVGVSIMAFVCTVIAYALV